MKKCPFCAEMIQDEAIKCHYCGETLTNDQLHSGQKTPQSIKNNYAILIVSIAVISLVLICCFLIVVGFSLTGFKLPTGQVETTKIVLPNQSQEQVQPQSETLADTGLTRENPVPLGTKKETGAMTMMITNVIRPANQIVADGNPFNTKPEEYQEYLMVEAQTTCLKKSTEKCFFTPAEFKAVGSDGNIISTQYVVVGVPGLFESGETFGGGTKAGRIFFIVPKGDPGVVLFYDPLLIGDAVFFSVTK